MFSQDDISGGRKSKEYSAGQRSNDVSRSSINARPSFKNPYMDLEKVTPATNNTSGIKSSLYSSGVRYSDGIKTYEQRIANEGIKDEPVYPQIQKFEENAAGVRQLTTITENGPENVAERRNQPK